MEDKDPWVLVLNGEAIFPQMDEYFSTVSERQFTALLSSCIHFSSLSISTT